MEPMDPGSARAFAWLVVSGWVALYTLPLCISGFRRHRHQMAIVALNLLLGWTVIGWVAALVWALMDQTKSAPPTVAPPADTTGERTLPRDRW